MKKKMEVINGKIDCKPEETGYDSSRIIALNSHFERLINEKMILGAVYTIRHKGKIIANGALGNASRGKNFKQMLPNTVFGVASITKIFTTVAILQLIEDGFLRLDSFVSDFLTQFKKEPFNNIQIIHLLTHTSGLYPDGGCLSNCEYEDAFDLVHKAIKNWDGKSDFDWITPALACGVKCEPGKEWMYYSFGFVILGAVIKKITGIFGNTYLEDKIMKPLKMNDSAFNPIPIKDIAKRIFVWDEDMEQLVNDLASGKEIPQEKSTWERLEIPSTGGGFWSTTNDLSNFGQMLLNFGRLAGQRILGRKIIEKATSYTLKNVSNNCWGANEPDRDYGIGFDMKTGPAFTYSKGTYMHEGSGTCSIDIDPKEQLIATWFTPWVDPNFWAPEPLFNVQNIIWSGLI